MIDLYTFPTPNGWKASIALEELALPYRIVKINIMRGEQFQPEFLKISPNNRVPAILDHEPPGGGAPLSVFESGAILLYLAEKTGRLLPSDLRRRVAATEWLMWQMGGLGPMLGQYGHFILYAPEKLPYPIERYTKEVHRLYGVMNGRLAGREYLADEFSVADIACVGWVKLHDVHQLSLETWPNVKRWYERMLARPGVQRGFDAGREALETQPGVDAEAKVHLFGHARN